MSAYNLSVYNLQRVLYFSGKIQLILLLPVGTTRTTAEKALIWQQRVSACHCICISTLNIKLLCEKPDGCHNS